MKNYHCCATCIHFQIKKDQRQVSYYCKRLGYETKPKYTFNCWHPKERVERLMNKGDSI